MSKKPKINKEFATEFLKLYDIFYEKCLAEVQKSSYDYTPDTGFEEFIRWLGKQETFNQ